jgi:GTPase
VTKIDLAPPEVYKNTLETINKVLKQARKMPYLIKTEEHVATAAKSILTDRITPILCISSVSGEGLDLLRALLRQLPPRVSSLAARGEAFTMQMPVGHGLDFASTKATKSTAGPDATGAAAVAGELKEAVAGAGAAVEPATGGHMPSAAGAGSVAGVRTEAPPPGETTIDSVFTVPGVGTVVAGTVMKGAIHVGSTMLLGPDRLGEFQPVTIRSIHVQYTDVEIAYPGGSAAFAIRPKGKLRGGTNSKRTWVRKGMCLVDPSLCPVSYWEFSAEILILHHQTTMSVGYAPIMHCGVVTQTAKITSIKSMDGSEMPAMRTGDRAIITFWFLARPEYILGGDMLLFRGGRANGGGGVGGLSCPNHSSYTE